MFSERKGKKMLFCQLRWSTDLPSENINNIWNDGIFILLKKGFY